MREKANYWKVSYKYLIRIQFVIVYGASSIMIMAFPVHSVYNKVNHVKTIK